MATKRKPQIESKFWKAVARINNSKILLEKFKKELYIKQIINCPHFYDRIREISYGQLYKNASPERYCLDCGYHEEGWGWGWGVLKTDNHLDVLPGSVDEYYNVRTLTLDKDTLFEVIHRKSITFEEAITAGGK